MEGDPKIIECCICLTAMRDPCTLSECRHTACLACLLALPVQGVPIMGLTQLSDTRQALRKCPLCNQTNKGVYTPSHNPLLWELCQAQPSPDADAQPTFAALRANYDAVAKVARWKPAGAQRALPFEHLAKVQAAVDSGAIVQMRAEAAKMEQLKADVAAAAATVKRARARLARQRLVLSAAVERIVK